MSNQFSSQSMSDCQISSLVRCDYYIVVTRVCGTLSRICLSSSRHKDMCPISNLSMNVIGSLVEYVSNGSNKSFSLGLIRYLVKTFS